MKIIIDADGSPVRKIVVRLAKHYDIPLIIISNVHHQIDEDYGEHVMVDAGHDVADHEIVKRTEAGDLVITQDYGLASLVLGKKADAIHQNGWFFTQENIDSLLLQRHLSQKMRKTTRRHGHIRKRKATDNEKFERVLTAYIKSKIKEIEND